MIESATSLSAFGVVVVIVGILGIVVALGIAIRHRDAFARERGRLWMFHGETDTSPHQMPGARFEERHVIDPEVRAETPQRPPVISAAPPTSRHRRTGGHTPHSRRTTRS